MVHPKHFSDRQSLSDDDIMDIVNSRVSKPGEKQPRPDAIKCHTSSDVSLETYGSIIHVLPKISSIATSLSVPSWHVTYNALNTLMGEMRVGESKYLIPGYYLPNKLCITRISAKCFTISFENALFSGCLVCCCSRILKLFFVKRWHYLTWGWI